MRHCCAIFLRCNVSRVRRVNRRVSLKLSEVERAAWRRHNLQTLAESAALPFEEKLAILEDLEEITIAMGYQRDPITGRLRKSKL
jgi:hypothetical protein